jgi:tetratricopeptide (TPR) repeat protein
MLAACSERDGDNVEAERQYRKALAIARKVSEDGVSVAAISNNLAGLLTNRGDYREAEELYNETLAIVLKVHGHEHPKVTLVLNNLGTLFKKRGDYKSAEHFFREALETNRKLLGDEHPIVAGALVNLGQLLADNGDYNAAEPLLRECLAIRGLLIDPQSVHYWLVENTRSLLGRALVGRGAALASSSPQQAIELFAEAEPLVLGGYEWLSTNSEQIDPSLPEELRIQRVREARERVFHLYDAWHAAEPEAGHDADAAAWRMKMEQQPEP